MSSQVGKVEVYWNLHKRLFSIRQKGKVIAHMGTVGLTDVTFRVQPAGRERVRREGKKNVHAYVKGTYDHEMAVNLTNEEMEDARPITYNPYKYDSFVYADTLTPVEHCDRVVLISRRMWEV
jgi:hypothetical protein